jgi:hypothetical protein
VDYIDMKRNEESEVFEGSYLFFDFIPADIESIRVIDNTKYQD